jgi:predicted nucleotidyltransferase
MADHVPRILDTLEAEHSIKILFSVESGSRVWGMASKDSDYDIRGVYIELDPIQRYKSFMTPKTKCIDGFTEDRLYDWVLWDVCTFLKFLKNNNPTVIDWILSTTCYRGDDEQQKIRDYFMAQCDINYYLLHHYGLVKSMYEKYVNPYRKTTQTINNKVVLQKLDQVRHDLDIIKASHADKAVSILNRSIHELTNVKTLCTAEYGTEADASSPRTDTKLKKILYVCRSALSLEYILQCEAYPSLDINVVLHDPELKLDFDKQQIADMITTKQNGNEFDACMCPEWLRLWYTALNTTVLSNYTKKKKPPQKTTPNTNVDTYVKYYMECDMKYKCYPTN